MTRPLQRPLCLAFSVVALLGRLPGTYADPPTVTKAPQPTIGVVGDVTYATDQEGLSYDTRRTRVLMLGRLDGSPESYAAYVAAWAEFHRQDLKADEARLRDRFTLVAAEMNLASVVKAKGVRTTRTPLRGFPPKGQAYTDEATAPAHYLWRWIGMHAPDVVIDVRHHDAAKADDPKETILRCPVAADVKRLDDVAKPWKVQSARGIR